jgi:hypothetical protein
VQRQDVVALVTRRWCRVGEALYMYTKALQARGIWTVRLLIVDWEGVEEYLPGR